MSNGLSLPNGRGAFLVAELVTATIVQIDGLDSSSAAAARVRPPARYETVRER
jgi:hypothetical protein